MSAEQWRLMGFRDGEPVFVSETLIAQKGERLVRQMLGFTRCFPVKTDLNGQTVMVEANSQEEAVNIYLRAVHSTYMALAAAALAAVEELRKNPD